MSATYQLTALNVRNATRSRYRTSNAHAVTPIERRMWPLEKRTNLLFPVLRKVEPGQEGK
jgi:hypothetical protein